MHLGPCTYFGNQDKIQKQRTFAERQSLVQTNDLLFQFQIRMYKNIDKGLVKYDQ